MLPAVLSCFFMFLHISGNDCLAFSSQASGDDGTVKFAYLSDLHISEGARSVRDLSLCIRDINSTDSLDFVIVAGDVTDFGSDSEIRLAKSMLDSLELKYYVVAGNHDAKWSESGCNTFREEFGYEHFEFEAGGWRFLGCNSGPDMRMAPALVPRESMVWLENLEPGRRSIFINHYPMDTSVLNYFDVVKLLKAKGVRQVMGGHWHKNTALDYDGLPGILGRSSMSAGKVSGYNIVTLKGDRISIAEKRVYGNSSVEMPAWYEAVLNPVPLPGEDAGGEGLLPESYPWMKYDVNEKYPHIREKWRLREDSDIASGFAVGNGGHAYYCTVPGVVKCISLKNGKNKWSRRLPGKIFSTPCVSGRFLVVGCTDGGIYCLDASDGSLIWKHEAGRSVLSSPALYDGKIYIGASDGVFRALNLRTGKLLWEFDGVEGFVECLPHVDSEQVVFGSWGNMLYSLNPETGELQWTWKCDKPSRMYSPAACNPVKSSGRIFIAVPDRRVYVLDAHTGKQLFYVPGGRETLCLSEDGSKVYVKAMYSSAYSFDASEQSPSGESLPDDRLDWNVRTCLGYDIAPTPLAVCGGMLVIPSDKGNIVALSEADGSLLWAHKISPALINPVKILSKRNKYCILVSSMDGIIVLLEI